MEISSYLQLPEPSKPKDGTSLLETIRDPEESREDCCRLKEEEDSTTGLKEWRPVDPEKLLSAGWIRLLGHRWRMVFMQEKVKDVYTYYTTGDNMNHQSRTLTFQSRSSPVINGCRPKQILAARRKPMRCTCNPLEYLTRCGARKLYTIDIKKPKFVLLVIHHAWILQIRVNS